jgi:hypothetical protein
MAQGPIDHPTYLTRQMVSPFTTAAGANGTGTPGWCFPWDVNIHQVVAVVKTAGTTSVNAVFLLAGTSTIASSTVTLGTSAAAVVGTSGNAAQKVTAGTPIYTKNSTDAVGVNFVSFEWNMAPDTGTWTGNE